NRRTRAPTRGPAPARGGASRREAAEKDLGELSRRAAERARFGAAERPRERDPVERAEDRARGDVRRDVLAERAGRLALGDDLRDRVEVLGEARRGELLHEPRRLAEDDRDHLREVALALEETELHVDHRAEARGRVGLLRELFAHEGEELLDA